MRRSILCAVLWLAGCQAGPPRCDAHLVPINPPLPVRQPSSAVPPASPAPAGSIPGSAP